MSEHANTLYEYLKPAVPEGFPLAALDELVAENQHLRAIVEIVARRRAMFRDDAHRNDEERTLDALLAEWRETERS